ncbi:hypothetical protein FQN57_002452 [Myotisia sp. PD_48]|nr:hypothetical protein FQN57_002452 [Myotisia sp. PD_48]
MVVTKGQSKPPSPPPVISGLKTPDKPPGSRHSQNQGQWAHIPSPLVLLWLIFSVPLVFWDLSYVFLRPHSMPGGKWHSIWSPYALYGAVDHIYGWPAYNAGDGFNAAQSAMNLIESACYVFYLGTIWVKARPVGSREKMQKTHRIASVMSFFAQEQQVDGRAGAVALVVVFSATLMTLSKTVLYHLNEVFSGFNNIGHNDLKTIIFLWMLPNGLWIVFPSIISYVLGKEVVCGLEAAMGASTALHSAKSKSS